MLTRYMPMRCTPVRYMPTTFVDETRRIRPVAARSHACVDVDEDVIMAMAVSVAVP
jgi:hypothetical protein